jgi:protein involved in temperature-dependent protein secretion
MTKGVLNTIANLQDGSTINIQGTKLDGTAYNRTVEFSTTDQRVEDVLTVTENGDYKSFKVSGIESISVA